MPKMIDRCGGPGGPGGRCLFYMQLTADEVTAPGDLDLLGALSR